MRTKQPPDRAARRRQQREDSNTPLELQPWQPKPKKPPPKKREKPLTKTERHRLNQAAYQFPTAAPEETRFRHQHWCAKRALVLAALIGTNATPRQLEAFENCGSQCVVEFCKATNVYRVRANHCHNRHCAPCAAAKAGILAANLRDKLEAAKDGQYRFVTLTLKHTETPLADQIKRLYTSFGKLRKCATWHTTQTGGCAILEVKWDPKTRHWHPHLHIVTEGRYLAQKTLSDAWLKATGDSMICDIRPLKSGKDAAHYVAKYVSKGTVDAVWTDTDAAQEWILATKGVRSASTYGTWRGYKLLARRPDKHEWHRIGLLSHIYADARAGSQRCKQILACLCQDCQYNPHRKRAHQNE